MNNWDVAIEKGTQNNQANPTKPATARKGIFFTSSPTLKCRLLVSETGVLEVPTVFLNA